MNYLKLPLVVLLSICVSGLLAIVPAGAQGQTTALERGYRTGYSDGYTAGFKDVSDNAARNFKTKRTISAPIVPTTKSGDQSRIIATVTSRVSKPATRQATNASSSIRLFRRDSSTTEHSAAPITSRSRQRRVTPTTRTTRPANADAIQRLRRMAHSQFRATRFSLSNC